MLALPMLANTTFYLIDALSFISRISLRATDIQVINKLGLHGITVSSVSPEVRGEQGHDAYDRRPNELHRYLEYN